MEEDKGLRGLRRPTNQRRRQSSEDANDDDSPLDPTSEELHERLSSSGSLKTRSSGMKAMFQKRGTAMRARSSVGNTSSAAAFREAMQSQSEIKASSLPRTTVQTATSALERQRLALQRANALEEETQVHEKPVVDLHLQWAQCEDIYIRSVLDRPQTPTQKRTHDVTIPHRVFCAEDVRSLNNRDRTLFLCEDFLSSQLPQLSMYRGVRGLDFLFRTAQADLEDEEKHEGSAPAEFEGSRWHKKVTKPVSSSTRAADILSRTTFFSDIEATKPGLIANLSNVVAFQREAAGQVVFRQGDPPGSCYIMTSGHIGVFCKSHSQAEDTSTPRAKPEDIADLPTLSAIRFRDELKGSNTSNARARFRKAVSSVMLATQSPLGSSVPEPKVDRFNKSLSSASLDSRSTLSSRDDSKQQPVADINHEDQVVLEPGIDGIGRHVYATRERFSTFREDSDLGEQVATLDRPGTVFGEVALQNDAPRSASIKCLTDVELMVIKAPSFRKVLASFLDVGKAFEVLRKVQLFADLEADQPGILTPLAGTASFIQELKDQVVFRECDPGKACFIVVSGQVGVFMRNSNGDPSFRAPKTPRKNPRGDQPTLSDWRRSGRERQHQAEMADPSRKFQLLKKDAPTFRTTEGFSTFTEDSNFGERMTLLNAGSLFGELALQHDQPRAATIVCSQDCELLALRKADYLQAVESRLTKVKFFDAYMPGAARVGKGLMQTHPSHLFKEELVPEGRPLLIEGMMQEAVICFVGAGGAVELRRHSKPAKSPSYVLSGRPLTAPDSSCASKLPRTQLGQKPSSQYQELQSSVTTLEAAEGEEIVATLHEGSLFASMAAISLPSAEPFSAVVTSLGGCKIYKASGTDLKNMPSNLMRILRNTLAKDLSTRLQRVRLPSEGPLKQNKARSMTNFAESKSRTYTSLLDEDDGDRTLKFDTRPSRTSLGLSRRWSAGTLTRASRNSFGMEFT